jgi:Meiotically up-regulated gene 113
MSGDYGYIYVIGFAEIPDLYKIGFTNNLERRLKLFDWASPFIPVVFHSIMVSSGQKIERMLHKTFKGKRVKLEWFSLTEDDLQFIRSIVPEVDAFPKPEPIPMTATEQRLLNQWRKVGNGLRGFSGDDLKQIVRSGHEDLRPLRLALDDVGERLSTSMESYILNNPPDKDMGYRR